MILNNHKESKLNYYIVIEVKNIAYISSYIYFKDSLSSMIIFFYLIFKIIYKILKTKKKFHMKIFKNQNSTIINLLSINYILKIMEYKRIIYHLIIKI